MVIDKIENFPRNRKIPKINNDIGKIVSSIGGLFSIRTIDNRKIYAVARGSFRNKKIKPLVGDDVVFGLRRKEEKTEYVITEVQKRKNELIRPALANVDFAIIVTALKEPEFNPNLLDRQIVALEEQKISPIILFSKIDLLNSDEFSTFSKMANQYKKIGYQVIFEKEKEKIKSKLLDMTVDKVSLLMGQTGAGKSTLMNLLDSNLNLITNEVSKALSRGKHTTRSNTLYQIGSSWIADTPGFSSFEVLSMPKEELDQYFIEFSQYKIDCQYRDCRHINESICGVKAAVNNREIMQSRYESYVNLYTLIEQRKPMYKKEN